MNLIELFPYIEQDTAICLTHCDMSEDWYRSEKYIPEDVIEESYVIGIGVIHPAQNEFYKQEPALRVYLDY